MTAFHVPVTTKLAVGFETLLEGRDENNRTTLLPRAVGYLIFLPVSGHSLRFELVQKVPNRCGMLEWSLGTSSHAPAMCCSQQPIFSHKFIYFNSLFFFPFFVKFYETSLIILAAF